MYVAPVPDLTAALTLAAAQMTSERGLVQTIVATPSCRTEGERAPPRGRGCGKVAVYESISYDKVTPQL